MHMLKIIIRGERKKSFTNVSRLAAVIVLIFFNLNYFVSVKARYGEDAIDIDSDLSSSSDDDEVGAELTEEIEKKFFKTLSCLKNKDPRIYDQNVRFFDESDSTAVKKSKEKKDKPVFIKDYERNLLLEKGGEVSDSDDEKDDVPR